MNEFEIEGRLSPLQEYRNDIESSVLNIAPEHGGALQSLINQGLISLEFDYKKGMGFRVLPDENHIKLSIRGLEFVWIAAYCYVTWYENYQLVQAQAIADKIESPMFYLNDDKCCRDAMHLFFWSKKNLTSEIIEPWPNQLPQPTKRRVIGSFEHQADELFLCAIAWVMHHEMGHITLDHKTTSQNPKAEEHEADHAATEWILKNAPNSDSITKRGAGIICAILAIRAVDRGGDSHPEPEERLNRFFETAAIQNHEKLNMFALVALQCQSGVLGNKISSKGCTLDEIYGDILSQSLHLED